jgi:hypothetical protein
MRNIFAAFFVAFFIPVIVAHTIAAADVANGVRAYDAGWCLASSPMEQTSRIA